MKRFILILAMVSTVLSMSAQLFWRVSGNRLEKDSYIFGTAHNAPISMIDEVPGLNDAIQNCDVAIGEIDKNDQSAPELSMADMMVPTDSTLDKLLSPEDYRIVEETVNKYIEHLGVSMDQFRLLKPSMIRILALDNDPSARSDTANNGEKFDLVILERAAAAGHSTMGFETEADHIEWLIKAPIKDQARWLLSMCKNHDNWEASDEEYISQDATVQFESRVKDEGYREIFVYQRNRNWAEKLDQMMPEQSCLVCVGAAHLSGEKGLIQLLRDRGYTVEPVK